MLLAGRPTKLSDLVREPAALDEARRRARAIAAKSRELAEERGILTCFLADRHGDLGGAAARRAHRAPRSPAAPVLLRSCTLRATGAGAGRLPARPRAPSSSSTRCSCTTSRSEQGITLDEDALEALTTLGADVRPLPGLRRAGPGLRRGPRLLGDAPARRRHLLLRQAADGRRPRRPGRRPRRPRRRRRARGRPRTRCGRCAPSRDTSRVDLDDPERDLLVLDADSSQQEAIEAVRSGSHLVVHGPPGTGKSQTIANLIATLAADGKRVLFVAEKRAAIDAVVGRLDRVGLGDLVLDLHAGAHGRRRVAARARRRPRPARGPDRRQAVARVPDAVTAASRVTAPAAARRTAAERLERARAGAARPARAVGRLAPRGAGGRVARSPASPPRRDPGCGCAARCSPASTAPRSPARRPPSRRVASLADWDARRCRRPVVRRRHPHRRRGGRGPRSGSSGSPADAVDDTARTLADVFRGIQLPDAADDQRLGRGCSPRSASVRDTLEIFRPEVFDIPLGDLVTATGSAAYRRSVGSELGWLDRWRLRRQARALLRPGRPPADLHAALAAASEQRVAWRQLAGSGGRPEIPVELDRARAAHAALRRRPRVARRPPAGRRDLGGRDRADAGRPGSSTSTVAHCGDAGRRARRRRGAPARRRAPR